MGAFPLLTSLTLLPPAVPAGVLTLPLLAALALLPTAPAEAQSVSVSNLSQASHATDTTVVHTAFSATAFTTGGTSTDTYTLNSVVLDVVNTGSGQMNVSIHNASGSDPGTKIGGNLSGNISSTAGNTTYTASGITLNGGTKYFLQIAAAASGANRSVRTTSSDSQTGTSGWTIENTGRDSSTGGGSWVDMTSGRSLKFTVNATTVTSSPPPPTTRAPVQRPWNFRSILRDGYVSLSWTPVPRATAYQYRHNTTGSFSSSDAWSNLSFAYVRQFAVVRAHAGVHGLTLGTTNYIQVRGVNADGQGPGSVILRIVPLAAPPAPTLTSATAGNRSVTLSWTVGSDPTRMRAAAFRYKRIEAEADGTCSEAAFRRAGLWWAGTQENETVSNLTAGQKYCFRVVSANQGQGADSTRLVTGAESNTRSATPFGPPPPVENIRITPNGTSLTVTWDASAGATGYDVTYTDNSSGRTARAAWDHAGTSVTITCDSRYPGQNRDCVRSGATYSVGVRAKNDRGASGWRNSGRPPTAPQPQPPSGDSCQTQLTGDGSVAGFWNERCDSAARRGRYAHYYSFTLAAQSTLTISLESRIDTYLLLRRGGQDGPILHRSDDWGGSYNSRISETLAAGTYTIEATTYHRWESGNFTLGVSGLGSTAPPQGTNPPPPVDESRAPDTVTNIRVRHNGTSLSVSWDASARATAYDVTYYDTGSRRNWRAAWNRAGTSLRITCDVRPEHSDEGCINSHTYTVGIRARNAAGTSGWTNSGRASEGGSAGSAAPAPALSVADATAAESSGSITFAVTLSPAAARWVYVDYSTHDGTASAGLDYTAGSGTLTFRPGETRKTVTVTLLDDAYDEGSETLELMLSNAEGAPLEDGLATGTITNDDPVPQSWIGRFGRTVAHQVLDAVEGRMQTPSTPAREVVIAGAHFHGLDQEVTGLEVASLRDRNLLTSSSFALTSGTTAAELRWSLWGRGALTSFDGRQDALTLDGNVTSALLGADWTWDYATTPEAGTSDGEAWGDGRWRAGLLLSHSRGDGSYSAADQGGEGGSPPGMAGKMKAHLTGLFPWARRVLNRQLAAWGVAGYGQGELTVTLKGADSQADGADLNADLNLWMAAGGLRGTLIDGGSDGLTVTGTTDAMAVGTSSGSVTGDDGTLAATQATVTRLRLGLAAQRPFPLGNREAGDGATLTPSLELGLRHDGGDAETGFGLDLGGGILLSAAEQGLAAELRGRALLSHAADGFRDQGFSGSLSWHQEPASDRGAVLSLTHTLGGASSGGAEALLSRVNLEGLAANNDDQDRLKNQRLELQLSYGLPAFGDRLTLTPELGLGLYDSGRDYRIGWNLTQPDAGESFAFSFDATRREDNNTAPEHGIELRLDTRF